MSYIPYNVSLNDSQKEKLANAIANSSAITLRLGNKNLTGNDELMLTKTQILRIQKALRLGKGVDIKISKTQARKVVKHGGALFSVLSGISPKGIACGHQGC